MDPRWRLQNAGAKWDRVPELVKDHDFRSEAEGAPSPTGSTIRRPIPARSSSAADTPAFAVDCSKSGGAPRVASFSGGSNGCAPRAWEFHLPGHDLRVDRRPLPDTAASKWNPGSNKLFEISDWGAWISDSL